MDTRTETAAPGATPDALELREELARLDASPRVPVSDDWPAAILALPGGESLGAYICRARNQHPTVCALDALARELTGQGLGLKTHYVRVAAYTASAFIKEWPARPKETQVPGRSHYWKPRREPEHPIWLNAPRDEEPERAPRIDERSRQIRLLGNRSLAQLVVGTVEAIRSGRLRLVGVPPDGVEHCQVPAFEMDAQDTWLDLAAETLGQWDNERRAVVPRFRVLRLIPPGVQLPQSVLEPGSDIEDANRRPLHNAATSNPPRPVMRQGGRPPKFDRGRIGRELLKLANQPDGLPETAAARRDLVRAICKVVSGEEPADSTLAEIMDEFGLR